MGESDYWRHFMVKRWSRRRLLQTGAAAGASLWAASALGCNSSTPAPTAQGGAGTTPAPGGSPQAQIQKGGKFRLAHLADASSLDPALARSGYDPWYTNAAFDPLVAYNRQGVAWPEASLAEKWDVTDPKTIVFKLRKGIKFHDGTPFNAQAVKYNIDRILDPKTGATGRASLLAIDSVEATDDSTATFHLKKASASLLANLPVISSPTAIDKYGDTYAVHPVGTGPFQFVEWVKGSYASFRRNPDYWRKDSAGSPYPYLDEIQVLAVTDATVRLANLQTGDADVVYIDSQDSDKVKKIKNLAVESLVGGMVKSVLVFNQTKPPMDDVNLRLAIAYAVDPDAINNTVHFGSARVAKGGLFAPASTWVYNETVPRPAYDPKKAKDYLAKAGKPDGFSVAIGTYSTPWVVQTAELIQAQLAQVGIKATIDVKEVGAATTAFFETQATPIFSTTWGGALDPHSTATSCFRSDGYYNAGKVKNDQLDALIDSADLTYDLEARKKIYNQVNEYILGQALWLPLLYGSYDVGYNQKMQSMDYFFTSIGKGRYTELWMKQ